MGRLAVLFLALAAGDPPGFDGVAWLDGAPDLKGKVAIVRWWTQG